MVDPFNISNQANELLRLAQRTTSAQASASGVQPLINNIDITQNIPGISSSTPAISKKPDLRVRLKPLNKDEVYGPPTVSNSPNQIANTNILSILRETNGMIFPFTPTINFNQTVSYDSTSMVHSNMTGYSYNTTPSVEITVAGKFTVQNQREGEYLLACIHFLKTASKSYFGEQDKINGKAGLPPPVLLFSGHGKYLFGNHGDSITGQGGGNELRVILTNHSYTFDDNVNLVTLNIGGEYVSLPSVLNISMNLNVVHTPRAMRKDFSLDKFRSGQLMRNNNNGWI